MTDGERGRVLGKGIEGAYWDVHDFHRKFGCVIGRKPGIPDAATVRLRQALISEEFNELMLAIRYEDLPGIADGVLDLVYVALGALVSYGVDPTSLWSAIHAANMSKVGGGTREDGKICKPHDFTPPDIAGLLKAQGWEGEPC